MFDYKDLKSTKKEIIDCLDKIEEKIKGLRTKIEMGERIEETMPLNIHPLIVKIRENLKEYHRLRKFGSINVKKQWWHD